MLAVIGPPVTLTPVAASSVGRRCRLTQVGAAVVRELQPIRAGRQTREVVVAVRIRVGVLEDLPISVNEGVCVDVCVLNPGAAGL